MLGDEARRRLRDACAVVPRARIVLSPAPVADTLVPGRVGGDAAAHGSEELVADVLDRRLPDGVRLSSRPRGGNSA